MNIYLNNRGLISSRERLISDLFVTIIYVYFLIIVANRLVTRFVGFINCSSQLSNISQTLFDLCLFQDIVGTP